MIVLHLESFENNLSLRSSSNVEFCQVKSNQIAKIHHKSDTSLTSESNRQTCLKFDKFMMPSWITRLKCDIDSDNKFLLSQIQLPMHLTSFSGLWSGLFCFFNGLGTRIVLCLLFTSIFDHVNSI